MPGRRTRTSLDRAPGRHAATRPAARRTARLSFVAAGACAGLIGQAIGLGFLGWPPGGVPAFPWWTPPAAATPGPGSVPQVRADQPMAWSVPWVQYGGPGPLSVAGLSPSAAPGYSGALAAVPSAASVPPTGDAVQTLAGMTGTVAGGVAGTVEQVVSSGTGAVDDAAHAVTGTVGLVVSPATGAVDDTAHAVTGTVGQVVSSSTGAVDDAARAVTGTAEQAHVPSVRVPEVPAAGPPSVTGTPDVRHRDRADEGAVGPPSDVVDHAVSDVASLPGHLLR